MSNTTRVLVSSTQRQMTPLFPVMHPKRGHRAPLRAPGLFFSIPLAAVLLLLAFWLFGCGGGYPGDGITGITSSAAVIDAGQSVAISAAMSGNEATAWTIVSTNCGSSGCGTLSATNGNAVTYLSPSSVNAPIQVVIQDAVSGTSNAKTVTITVDPDPTITGQPQSGTVGTAYNAQLTDSGGTGALKMSLAGGALPAGLTFNAATGMISGTPTTTGTYNFVAQVTDSAPSPYTASASETIVITAPGAMLSLLGGNPPSGTVGTAYSTALVASGGTQPYLYSILSGSLPTGLTLAPSTGVISGVPATQGTFTFTAQAQDAVGSKATATFSITIKASGTTTTPISITVGSLPNGTVAVPYSATIGVTGGTAPYSCAITSGVLPAGLALGANCVVSGTPTVAGTANLIVKATDSSNPVQTTSGPVSITIVGMLAITTGTLPNGMVGTPYSSIIGVTGGSAPYTCALVSGTLPAGLTLGASCLVSGIPTVAGTANLMVRATDSSSPVLTTTGAVSITITPAALTITTGTLPNGTVGTLYNSTLGVTGGTGPYTCTLASGSLPAGLAFGPNCAVTGTPTVAGTSTPMIKVTDSSNPVLTTTGPVSITINPAPVTLTITTGTLPNGTVGTLYSSTIGVSGGTAPYTCTITSGSLPAGLALGANCLVSGTPTTAGTSNLTVKATDSANPQNTGSGPVSITISPASATLAITTGTLPNGVVGTAYSSIIGVSGGTAPYTCTITSGTLPAGLTLGASCLVSGTPTTAGISNLTVKATDSANPQNTGSGPVSITINPAPATLTITTGTLPNGIVGTAYNSTIGVSGGTAPYTCTITGGTLPAGLALGANCLVSGTPTMAGIANLTVKATDSANPQNTGSGPVSITIVAAPVLVISNPPTGTVGMVYTGIVPVSGGMGPYTCSVKSGSLPVGLTLNANCTITGTPTMGGTVSPVIGVVDSSNPPVTGSGPVTITINPASTTLTVGNPPAATVGAPYTGTIPVSGGMSPYTCVLASGTLPAGLTLNANCTVTGTPTGTAGATPINVTVTDSSNPQIMTTAPVIITVLAPPALTFTGTLPNGIVNVAYSQTLKASGGVAPYTYAITAGVLPAGLTLSTGGVVSGIPTTPGATAFTVTATDSEATPQTAPLPLTLLIVYAPTATDGILNGPYAFLFQGYDDVVAGVLSYQTAAIGSFTADGTGAINAGEQDANHQGSKPAGTTVPTTRLLGTYTLGTDDRGSLTLTTFNADGTTHTATYAISVKAPVAPATTATHGSFIEFDSNQLVGTRGSGTFLAQTATSFTAGLTGNYAFGMQGDTPCLPACTVGIVAGPAAAVGQFTTGAGALSNGTGDTNIASTNYASSALSGTYGAADSNGRVQMALTTSNMPIGVYPSDFAVYMVNANQAFVMSTDKHSAYVLLAGSATSQTTTTFSNASLSGPFVGYENSPTNPGLVGTTLQNVLNLSTATIFRGTANAAGTCTTTNVDQGGVTGLANGLTGLGSGSNIINALLGTYASTGNSNCTVAASGRAVLNYPVPSTLLTSTLALLGLSTNPPAPRVVYLTSPNAGYFLETGYAGLGSLEAQTGAPFALATLKGTYVYGSTPAASAASTNASGVFIADGAGHATTTLDENVGVGTINVLQLGVAGNFSYVLTDATAGRFLLGTSTVVYAINPNRFVLLDENATTTSPAVALID